VVNRGSSVPASSNDPSFDEIVLPHLDAARRLARWLLRNEQDAEDAVQESSLRAFRYFRTFTGGNGRAWFLRIVRNTIWNWHRRRTDTLNDQFDEKRHSGNEPSADPETLLLQTASIAAINQALSQMPARFREVLVRRQVDGLSYRELAAVLEVPIGTVMSNLSRARVALRAALNHMDQPVPTNRASREGDHQRIAR
jgi:RNA polymerase sigma-70 factor (ECF subfamily)